MNMLRFDRQVQVVNALCQGMSLRAITRLLDVHRSTTIDILVRVGENCERIHMEHMKALECVDIQVDEIRTFVQKKQGRLTAQEKQNQAIGDQYLFYAVDHATKLVPAWELGKRDYKTTWHFMRKLRGSLTGVKRQISSDAFNTYPNCIEAHFGSDATHACVTKEYEQEDAGRGRYGAPRVSAVTKFPLLGSPNLDRACTSHIERANLTLRNFQRKFTRLKLGFSKKLENLRAACALHFCYYNFIWIPRTQRVTPAMVAGVTDRIWKVADLVD